MTADIELPPLPEADDSVENHAQWPIVIDSDVWLQKSVQDYARAVAEHNVKARDAEIEALRAEVDEWKRRGEAYFQTAEQQGKRAERLAEALQLARDLVEDWAGYSSTCFRDKHDLAGDLALLDAALRDHDKEGSGADE